MPSSKDPQPETPSMTQSLATAPPGVQLDGPACPRHRWFAWRHEQPEHQGEHDRHHHHHHHWHMWHHSHRWHRGDSKESHGPREWTPQDWQQWKEERRRHGCPFRERRSRCSSVARVPLDDSRWLEDYFAWY